jgi:hypothetical protein
LACTECAYHVLNQTNLEKPLFVFGGVVKVICVSLHYKSSCSKYGGKL